MLAATIRSKALGFVGGLMVLSWSSLVWTGEGDNKASPELVVQNGSTSTVHACASKDGRLVFTSNSDTTARLCDAATGLLIREFPEADAVASLSPDGIRAVTSSTSGDAIIWDTARGTIVRRIPLDRSGLACVAFSADGTRFIAGGTRGEALIRQTETGAIIQRLSCKPGGECEIGICDTPVPRSQDLKLNFQRLAQQRHGFHVLSPVCERNELLAQVVGFLETQALGSAQPRKQLRVG